jgi:predicted metal-dependent peptidase
VRRTGEQRRTLDFVTEHHIYAVGDLICHNCDFAINLMLQKSGFTIWEHALCDAKYDGMSAEQIYDEREKERDERIRNGGSKGQKGKGKPGEGTADGGFDEDDGDGMGGDVGEPEAMDSATKAEIERSINQTVAQAASVARMQGKMPADLARLVDTILNPKVSWRELLQFYMTKVTHDDETWSRRDRRHQHVYLPGRDGSKSGEINIIVDTSGSIGDNDLAQVAAELREIAEVVKPERIRAIYVDAAVAGEQVFNEGEPVMLEARGGGGTDMRVGLEHVLKYDPAVVVMITDCATPWPDSEPAYPLITISTTKGECPWGQTVHYERES